MDREVSHYKTSDVSERQGFAYWQEVVCDTYVPLECQTRNTAAFSGEIKINRLPKVATSIVSGSQQIVRRRKRDIGKLNDASFLVSLQLRESALVQQSGRSAELHKGDFALYSSTDTYKLTLPDNFRQLVIQVPRDDLLRRLPNADRLTGIQVRGNNDLGAFASESLVRLVKFMDQTGNVVQHCIEDTVVDLIATGLATASQEIVSLSQPEQQIMLLSDAFIRSNLSNPELDRNLLARAIGLSVRRLNQIYNSRGTSASAAIRDTRLERIASDLVDGRFETQTITEVAMRWGVNNLQHFSQMFRRKYGLSPSEYRQRAKSRVLN